MGVEVIDSLDRDGASRARTGDLLHAMQALSQLSYGPKGRPSVYRRSTRYPGGVHRYPRGRRFRRLPRRIARFVRALFGGGSARDSWDDTEGGVGVREPRRPLTPSLTGAAALELPSDDGEN
jgi:hypothetical protein